jgi:predicted transcriptional regulator
LRVLEANHLVTGLKSGRRRCYFATADGLSRDERMALATLSSAAVRRVYHEIRRQPGIRQQELAALLEVSPTSVIFHARRLEAAGVVARGRHGRETAYYPVVDGA